VILRRRRETAAAGRGPKEFSHTYWEKEGVENYNGTRMVRQLPNWKKWSLKPGIRKESLGNPPHLRKDRDKAQIKVIAQTHSGVPTFRTPTGGNQEGIAPD